MSSRLQLDHIVFLLPYQDVVNPPEWVTKHFTVSPGGRHADGKTENKLVLFPDGSYLELVAFIDDDPQKRKGHWWDKPYGIVDYALTTPDSSFAELSTINDRLSQTGTSISYEQPREGGRTRPDGVELKWRVTNPEATIQRGAVPFFCHDVTPRDRRVPLSDNATRHPAGVTALGGVLVQVPKTEVERVKLATTALLGNDANEVDMVQQVSGVKQPSIEIQAVSDSRDLLITLVVQSKNQVPAIREKVGNGLISITFE